MEILSLVLIATAAGGAIAAIVCCVCRWKSKHHKEKM